MWDDRIVFGEQWRKQSGPLEKISETMIHDDDIMDTCCWSDWSSSLSSLSSLDDLCNWLQISSRNHCKVQDPRSLSKTCLIKELTVKDEFLFRHLVIMRSNCVCIISLMRSSRVSNKTHSLYPQALTLDTLDDDEEMQLVPGDCWHLTDCDN